MKTAFMLLFANLTSVACVVGAVYLASLGISGWGWVLLVGLLCAQTVETKNLD